MRLVTIGAALVGLAALSLTPSPGSAQQPTVQRKVLLTEDLPIPGYQTVMATIEIPAGGARGAAHASGRSGCLHPGGGVHV